MRSIGALTVSLGLMLAVLVVPSGAIAQDRVADEARFLQLINAERAATGRAPLSVYWDLVDDARAQSAFQAGGNCSGGALICHNHDLASVTTGWYALGENVGVGPSVDPLHAAFMASAPHRANVLGDYNYAGIGVVYEGNLLFVTVVFMRGPSGLPAVEPGAGGLGLYTGFPVGADLPGRQDPATGVWTLQVGDSTNDFYYGVPSDIPVACDWDGDSIDTVGLYRYWTGFLHLRNSNTQGFSDVEIFYGVPEDLPVCGDWNGDGTDTIGIFRSSEGRFYLRNSNTLGFADVEFVFGEPGDTPLAGDWDGDGMDTVAVYRPSTGKVYTASDNVAPSAAGTYLRGDVRPTDRVVAGDWDGDGRDSVGYYRPSDGAFHLSNELDRAYDEIVAPFGAPGINPIVGRWV